MVQRAVESRVISTSPRKRERQALGARGSERIDICVESQGPRGVLVFFSAQFISSSMRGLSGEERRLMTSLSGYFLGGFFCSGHCDFTAS